MLILLSDTRPMGFLLSDHNGNRFDNNRFKSQFLSTDQAEYFIGTGISGIAPSVFHGEFLEFAE